MRYISLFSGVGGFDLGFQRAGGLQCQSLCEIDKYAQMVLRRNFPGIEIFDDVRKVGRKTHAQKSIDLVVGGFPCQDVSIAGRRAGINGERSKLWFEFARVIDELEPQWVIIENVPGLLSVNGGRDFATIIYWLAQRGYGVVWRVLDAQYFGVPQRRRRVFIVASFRDGRSAKVLFESKSSTWDTPPGREAWKGVACQHETSPSINGKKIDASYPCASVADTITAQYASNRGANGGNNSKTTNLLVVPTPRGIRGDQFIVRRLTPLECERLQGFPDGWTDGLSDTARYRLLGNAVAVPVAEWIGKRIVEA